MNASRPHLERVGHQEPLHRPPPWVLLRHAVPLCKMGFSAALPETTAHEAGMPEPAGPAALMGRVMVQALAHMTLGT